MDMHALETNLDLKQNLNVYANCKQLDILHLVFNIFDDGVQADLTYYKVRLKAMKSDNVPLIQDTQYTLVNNVVTIIANEQLTTTSGITKIELEFINKTTGEKKATFNLNLKVIGSTLEIERSISVATYTLLEELENKLDQTGDLLEHIDEAIEANNYLKTAITNSNTTNSNLEFNTATGNKLNTDLEKNIISGNTSNTDLETTINDGNNLKISLDTANSQAKANITVMGSLGDVSKLAENVQTNTNSITEVVASLSEKAKDTDSARTTTSKTVTGAINELDANKASKDGTIQTKLNADMLDGKHASDFAPSGYGLGTIATNISNIDLNTMQTTGFYQGHGMPNAPTNGFYYLTVITYGGSWTVQNVTGFGLGSTDNAPDDMYSRTLRGGTWGAWRRIAYSETMNLALINGWANYASGFDSLRATRVGNVITLSGLIRNGTIGTACALLPVGWRPPTTVLSATMNTNNATIGRIDVQLDGGIMITTASSNTWVSLTGVSFFVAN